MTIDDLLPRIQKTDDCWLWKKSLNNRGYGTVRFDRTTFMVHRLVYELLVAPIPKGLELHHKCGVKHCCNPDHMLLAEKDRHPDSPKMRTHCKQGHEFTPENTRFYGSRRVCRRCNRLWQVTSCWRRGVSIGK